MNLHYLKDVIIAVVLCILLLPAFGCVVSGGNVDFVQIMAVCAMFLDMLPTSIIEPFIYQEIFQIEISLSWIIMAVLISIITAIATPPIPGGAVIGYSILFSQLGLPEEGLAIILAIDVITDFLITSTDIFCIPMALAGVAKRYGLLDEEKLRN